MYLRKRASRSNKVRDTASKKFMKYSSLENFETARICTKLSSSLFACWKFDSLAVRGLSVGLEGEVEGGARDSPPGNAALFRSSSPIAAEVDFSGRAPFPWPKIYERRSTFQGRRIYARSPASFDGLREASVCASIGPLLVNYS